MGKIFQLCFRIREIKPEIGLHVPEVVALAEGGEILLRRRIIFLVVVLDAEPLENFRGDSGVGTGPEESVHFPGEGRAVLQIKERGNNPKRGQIVILLPVQLTCGVERRHGPFVILGLEGGLTDVVVGLRRHRTFRKLLEQLPEGIRHSLGIILLPENERFLLESGFPFLCGRKFRQEDIQILQGSVVILGFLQGEGALGQSGWQLRAIRKASYEITEGLDYLRAILELHKAPAEFVGGFGAQFWGEVRGPQLCVNGGRVRELLFLVKMLGLQQLRLVGPLGRGTRSQILLYLRQKRRRIAVVEID